MKNNDIHSPSITQIFATVVEQYGRHIALADEQTQLTYRELDAASNRIANALLQKHPNGYSPIIVYMDRSIGAVITILAILKTGRPYLPVDKSFSESQLTYIAQDSQVECLVTDQELTTGLLPCYSYKHLSQHADCSHPIVGMENDALAYIMYTSGSTGLPKGVQIEHSGVIRLVVNADYIDYTKKDVVAHCSSIGFDASTFELWLPLLNGGQIYVISKQNLLDFEHLEQQIFKGNVSTMWLTVALFNTIYTRRPETLSRLDKLLIGGDALNIELVRAFMNSEYCRLSTFINGYGPTENTTFTTTFNIFELDDTHQSVPIGKAINGTKVDVIDEYGHLVVGQGVGELIASGDGLARGYTCQTETARKFFVFRDRRSYRTGDLVRKLRCGNLEFVSRKDHEVKIRGLRVNLSQVEEAFHQLESVRQCYVRSDKTAINEALVAYVEVMGRPSTDLEQQLRLALSDRLPTYMHPDRMVLLESIPLTRNGKVDIDAIEHHGMADDLSSFEHHTESVLQVVLTLYKTLIPSCGTALNPEQGFFELGGNSLQIYQLLNLLALKLNVKISVKDFLSHQSAQALAGLLEVRLTQDFIPQSEALKAVDRWPISPAQRRLWYIEKLHPSTSLNLLAFGYTINGSLDINQFEKACRDTVAQHGSFNTRFIELEDEVFLESAKMQADVEWISGETWQNVYEREISIPFDYHNGPLIRFRLLTLGVDQHLLLLFSTHLVLDGWSVHLLIQAISDGYECAQKGYPLPERDIHEYRRFCLEMVSARHHHKLDTDLAFWTNYLAHCRIPLTLPRAAAAIPADRAHTQLKNQISIKLDSTLSQQLASLAKKNNVSLFSLLTYHYGETLCEFSALDELVLAIPTANREGFADTIGMFVNTIPFRVHRYQKDVKQVHQELQQCLSHSSVYLDEIQQHLSQLGHNINFQSLQVGIALQNTGHDHGFTLAGCQSSFFPMPIEAARFDLFAHCSVFDQHTEILFEFNSRTIYVDYVKSVLALFTQRLRASVEDMPHFLPAGTVFVPRTKAPSYTLGSLASTLQSVWASVQHQVAILSGAEEYTYKKLSADIQTVKRSLNDKGFGPGHRIGISFDPCYEYIVTVFALLLNGCSFVPLDSRYPQERLQFIISDAELCGSLNITDTNEEEASLCRIADKFLVLEPYPEPSQLFSPDEACLLYTSGSTGTPKGVQICLASILRLTQTPNFLKLTQNTRFLVASSPAFDASLLEIFVPLVNGLSCAIVNKEILLDYEQLSRELATKAINTAWFTVSLFNDIYASHPHTLQHLDSLLIGGDALNLTTVRDFMNSPYCRLKQFINGYGPTECTTFSTWFDIFSLNERHTSVPIGQPINDTHVYLLDSEKKNCLYGQVGEIAIGAPWLKPNYHNRSALNDEKFILNPFRDADSCHYLYLSGDLARYNADGDIEYISRRDQMIKIRGYRVELAGINQVLLTHPAIKNAHTGVVEQPDKKIVAYVVLDDQWTQTSTLRNELMSYLRIKLEPFQVPSSLVFLEQLPLTINGKVDHQQLTHYMIEDTVDLVAPRTPLESQIHAYWAELTNCSHFCITERFFDIGGHSLLVLKVINRLTELTGKKIKFVDFLHHQTVADLAEFIMMLPENEYVVNGEVTLLKTALERYPVTPQQLNLYFSHEFSPHKALYNIPVARHFTYQFEYERLQRAVDTIFTQTRILGSSLCFDSRDDLYITTNHYQTCHLPIYQVTNLKQAITHCQVMAEVPFELHQEPLIRFCYLPIEEDNQSVIFLNIHHIIADESSIQFLFKILIDCYETQLLSQSSYDYLDYCHSLQTSKNSSDDDILRTFWSNQFEGYSGLMKFTQKERSEAPDNLAYREKFELCEQTLNKLNQVARASNGSIFETALALYQMAVSKVSSLDDIVIGFPYSPRIDVGLIDTVGYFVDLIPTRVHIKGTEISVTKIASLIQTNREFLAHRPINPAISYVSDIRRCYNYLPLVQNAFSFHYHDSPASHCGHPLDLRNRYCRFDTVFTVTLQDRKGTIEVECVKDLYSQTMLRTLFDAFVDIVKACDLAANELERSEHKF